MTSGGAAPFALADGWVSECTFTPVAPGAVSLSGLIGGATRGPIVVSGDIQLLGAPSLVWDVEQRVRQALASDADGAFWWIHQEAEVLTPAVATAAPVPTPPAAWPTLRAVPNPAPAESRVTLTLTSPLRANVSLFTPSGRRVRELWAGNLPAGVHDWRLDARGLAPGVYFLRAEGPGVRAHAKLVLAR